MTTKEKPIIFSTSMVRAIMDGRKTQMRRVIARDIVNCFDIDMDRRAIVYIDQATGDSFKPEEMCPYRLGDILWVRETFAVGCIVYGEEPDGRAVAYISQCKGENDYIPKEYALRYGVGMDEVVWKPSIHMPREAARLFLEVKNVRAERLQNISYEDAIAEGTLQWICEKYKSGSYLDNAMRGTACAKPERAFALLWDTLNAKRGYPWENNPWVWVIEFMRIE